MAYDLVDFSDIFSMVIEELKLDSNDTNELARIKRDINAIYLDEVVPFKRWTWLSGHSDVRHMGIYSDGTVTVTPASTTITFSVAPSTSKTGYLFATDNYNEIYVISAHTGGSTTATLASAWTGEYSTTSTFKVWTDQVALPTDCRETVEVWHDFYRQPMEGMGLQDLRRRSAENPKVAGRPLYYTTFDYNNDTDIDGTRYRVMKVYPSIYEDPTTIHIDYVKDASPLSLSGDEPLMPVGDRIVLVYGALSRAWQRARNPESSQYNRQLFEQKLARMAGKLEDSTDKPQITPNSLYLSRKRSRGLPSSRMSSANSGSSYQSPSYLANPVIAGAQITGNVTVSSSITIDGRDISADGALLDSHIADTSDAHDASAISSIPAGNLAASNVQDALDELQSDVDTRALASGLSDHLADTSDAHDASAISFSATGAISSTDVQAAIAEVDSEKLPKAGGTMTGALLITDGTSSAPSVAFSDDTNTGLYSPANDSVALVAGSYEGIQVKKSTGSYANVGLSGATPSSSDSYPLLIERTVAGQLVGQISNPSSDATASAKIQLSTDAGDKLGELGVFPNEATTDAYSARMTIRPSGNAAGLSLIGGDLATGDIRFYVAGDYASTGRALQVNADKSLQFMQEIATPATPASGTVKVYPKSDDHLYKLDDGGTEKRLLAHASVTEAETGYLSGVTSAIQTQINTKAPSASPTFSGTITTPLTASKAVVTGASSELAASTTTSTEIGYVAGVTSAIQTQLDAKTLKSTLTTKGDLYVATASATIARQGIGSDGQVLTADSAQTNGLKWATPSAIANTDITGQTADTSPAIDDLVVTSDTSAGALKKVRLDDVFKVINGMTADASPDGAADYVATYDASASSEKKVLVNNLVGGVRPMFAATRSTNQTSVSHNTHTKVQFATEVFDTNSNYDNATNYRFTPTVAGKYLVTAQVYLASNVDTGRLYTEIYKNGSVLYQGHGQAANADLTIAHVSAIIDMNGSTDYLEIFAFQNSGSTQTIAGNDNLNFFMAARLA